jgi:hypothetical protein
LTIENLAGHILYGWSRSQVDGVWVGGREVVRGREVVGVDRERIRAQAQEVAKKLWNRM